MEEIAEARRDSKRILHRFRSDRWNYFALRLQRDEMDFIHEPPKMYDDNSPRSYPLRSVAW